MKTVINHGTRAHSLMSPSGFGRVIACPGSVALCAPLPETPTSAAAAEGTDAHEWGETVLRSGDFDALPLVGMTRDGKARALPLSREMATFLNVYLEHVKALLDAAPITELYVETRVSLAEYFGNDDGDGTADAMVYDVKAKHLHVIDLKYGAGTMVSPENNPQALQYALGAIEGFKDRGVNSVTIWIVQPRAFGDTVKRWDVDLLDLWDWKVTVRETIAAARAPNAPLNPSSYCRYCRANPMHCPALKAKVQTVAASGFTVPKPGEVGASKEALGKALDDALALKTYIAAVEELASSEAMAGRIPVGRKWVQTLGNRAWAHDEAATAKAFADAGASPYKTTLKSPAEMDKALGKDGKDLISSLVKRSQYYSLVSVKDKRPQVDYVANNARGFTPVAE